MTRTSVVLTLLILASRCERGFSKDVFASSAHLKLLVIEERNLIEATKSYVSHERMRMNSLERLISEIESDRDKPGSSTDLTSHPVDVIHLIHRFTSGWRADVVPLLFDSTALENARVLFESVETLIPREDDYEGSKTAIIRLQHTYQLPIDSLINGTVLDRKTKPMSQQMAADVACYALHRRLYDDALAWLSHAWNHLIPPLVPWQRLCRIAARVYAQKGEALLASQYAKYAQEIDPSSGRHLEAMSDQAEGAGADWPGESEKTDRLCEEYLVEDQRRTSIDAKAVCVYERGRTVPFMRTKVEYLHRSPDVVLFHDFITDKEADRLMEIGTATVERAEVTYFETNRSTVAETRIGKTHFISDDRGEPLVRKLSMRTMDFTGLETRHPYAEYLQLSNYGLGGHFSSHYDHNALRDRIPATDAQEFNRMSGDRIATLMIYLNQVDAGGATVFPKLDLGTRPVKNAAIFWYNINRSGFTETKSEHAGCPVLIGEKWVANKWIREFGQEFRRPCELTVDE